VPAVTGRRLVVLLAALAGALPVTAVGVAAFSDSASVAGEFAAAADFSPVLRSVPDVLGAPREGSTLTVNDADYEAGLPPTGRTYRWLRCNSAGGSCTAIASATGTSYVVSGVVGSTIRVEETAVRGAAPAVVTTSDPTIAAQSGGLSVVPTNTSSPSISGTTAVGQTLTAATGSWSGASGGYDYQWLRCNALGTDCVAVGANASTYLLTALDSGARMRVRVIAKVFLSSTTNAATTPDTSIVN
jgi:hypothetical protein